MAYIDQTPKIAPSLIWRLLDDDAVVVSPRVGKVHVLNGVGTIIWQLQADPKTIDEIKYYMVSHYDIALEQAHIDLQKFLNDLSDRGMVIWET